MTVEELRELLNQVPDDWEVWINGEYGLGGMDAEYLLVNPHEGRLLIDVTGRTLPGYEPLEKWQNRRPGMYAGSPAGDRPAGVFDGR